MVQELIDLEIEEISAVDHPANGRRFLIIKRATAQEEKSAAIPSVTAHTLAKAADRVARNQATTTAEALDQLVQEDPTLYRRVQEEHPAYHARKAHVQKAEGLMAEMRRHMADVQGAHPDWSEQQATDAVMREHPELYERYRHAHLFG